MKSDDRAELDRLMATFQGEIKRLAPSAKTPSVKTKAVKPPKGAKAAGDSRFKAAEATMRVQAPPAGDAANAVAESGARLGSGIAGATSRTKEVDHYDPAKGPRDHAHRAFRWPEDARSRGYIEMMINADDKDFEDYTGSGNWRQYSPDEHEGRFRAAAKRGSECGACSKAFESKEPVWRIRRKYDGAKVQFGRIFETEEIVAPICSDCWDGSYQSSRVVLTGPCRGCGREVHVATAALQSWLAHGKAIYCCNHCARRPVVEAAAFTRICETCGKAFAPKRLDARFCKAGCRVKANRKNKSL